MTQAFDRIASFRDAPIFIFGDHASKFIPPEYQDLELSGDDLTRHIAWDIGTETLIRYLCQHFGCAGLIAGVSRLVIDLNRDPAAPGLIPLESDGSLVPGNQNLSELDRKNRMERFYMPYHNALARSLDGLSQDHTSPFVVSVHSFTDQPLTGDLRKTDIGLLMKHDAPSAYAFKKNLIQKFPNFSVDINLPYSANDLNYTVDLHIAPRGFNHLAIEVRQSHIDTVEKAEVMAQILAVELEALLH